MTNVQDVTLQQIKSLLPSAIEILSQFDIYGTNYFVILMPYSFSAPTAPVFGDRLEILMEYNGQQVTLEARDDAPLPSGFTLLSQFVSKIYDYIH